MEQIIDYWCEILAMKYLQSQTNVFVRIESPVQDVWTLAVAQLTRIFSCNMAYWRWGGHIAAA